MKYTFAIFFSAFLLAGCAHHKHEARNAGKGALIGALGGAAISGRTGGNALQGAALGAAAGGVVGYMTADGKKREVREDHRGRYWTDEHGRRHPAH